jgi:hypothetical protein
MGNIIYQKIFGFVNNTPGYFKQMPNFEKLVDLCTEDARQSAIISGKWKEQTKMTCRRMLSIYIIGKNIENNYPELFKLAVEEAND